MLQVDDAKTFVPAPSLESILIMLLELYLTTQRQIAEVYAMMILHEPNADFKTVNDAIKNRYSESGLKRIKKMAWKMLKEGVSV